MRDRWECRYSSCEMMYIQLEGNSGVKIYLDHSPNKADHYTFDEVLAGAMDNEVGAVFGQETLAEVKAAVRERMTNPPKPYDKQAEMERRRREG